MWNMISCDIILLIVCCISFLFPSNSIESTTSSHCSIPLLCENKLCFSYPTHNVTEVLINIPQFPVDSLCVSLQAVESNILSSLPPEAHKLHCYDGISININWILMEIPFAYPEGYYELLTYTNQRLINAEGVAGSTQYVNKEAVFVQQRAYPEYDSPYGRMVSLPYGGISYHSFNILLFNTHSDNNPDRANLQSHMNVVNNEVLAFHPSSYEVQHLRPSIQVISSEGSPVTMEPTSFFFSIYFLKYQDSRPLESFWSVRNTLPSLQEIQRRMSSTKNFNTENRPSMWKLGRGDFGYLEIVLSPEDLASQRHFQSHYDEQQKVIKHQHRKMFTRQQWCDHFFAELQQYFHTRPKQSTRKLQLFSKDSNSKANKRIEICIFSANELDGQKQIWIQQMKHLSSEKFHFTVLLGFENTKESIQQGNLLNSTIYGSNSMYRILQAMDNVFVTDNSGNRVGIAETDLNVPVPDGSIPFGKVWDYQNYTAMYEYIHQRFELANRKVDQMTPLWCRRYYQSFLNMLRPLHCDIMVLGNMKGFNSDVFLVDVAKAMNIPMIFELTSFDLHEAMLPEVIIAPSHYALFDPTVQIPLQNAKLTTGSNPVFTVISPSVDFSLFNPERYKGQYLHPPPNCPIAVGALSWKYEPCVVIAFVARIVPGKNPGLFLQAAYHILQNYPFARFKFIGSSVLDAELKSLARRLRLEHVVEFVGWADSLELPGHLSDVDIVINPSLRGHSETFCIANIEVMGMGIPLVTFAIGGIGEYVTAPVSDSRDTIFNGIPMWEEAHNAIIVNVAIPEAIADATIFLITNPDKAKAIGINGRNSVIDHYSVERQMNQYDAIYQSVYVTKRNHDEG